MVATHRPHRDAPSTDRALRITVPGEWAEIVGALLMDRLGSYEDVDAEEGSRTLVFYPDTQATGRVDRRTVERLLPHEPSLRASLSVEWERVPRDWVDGWRRHFRPLTVGRLYLRPPWEPPAAAGLVDVVINPGLAFGTGLHPTTRGVLSLLQEGTGGTSGQAAPEGGRAAEPVSGGLAGETPVGAADPGTASVGAADAGTGVAHARPAPVGAASRIPLVDVGTGSGILAIAGAKLGHAPVRAFDHDPLAVQAAAANAAANGVEVEVWADDLLEVPLQVFAGAVVLANLTLGPVTALLRRVATLAGGGGDQAGAAPRRLLVSGILAGAQERAVVEVAGEAGFVSVNTYREGEWVSMDLQPVLG